MEVRIIHNRLDVYEFLKDKSRYNYTYQFMDLEENNWNNVICYGLYDGEEIKQIAMLLINYGIPVLLAACFKDKKYNIELLNAIKVFLPSKFYTHIDEETLKSVFGKDNVSDQHEYMNMGLKNTAPLDSVNVSVRLGCEKINDIKGLLSESYPDAWLDDKLVKLGRNFGVYEGNKLVSFAGIHAYSEEFQVVAVAHVTTHPDFRRKGYGEMVVASLINDLKNDVRYIGLNVKTDNTTAINCYKKLGFEEYGRFVGCEIYKE
jgi:ribosomal protein S18 acetylase RimI-like enzyme